MLTGYLNKSTGMLYYLPELNHSPWSDNDSSEVSFEMQRMSSNFRILLKLRYNL